MYNLKEHPIDNATKQAAEETRKELAPMKKILTEIDGALVIPGERVAEEEESEDTDDTDSVTDTASIGDSGESPD